MKAVLGALNDADGIGTINQSLWRMSASQDDDFSIAG
jgi:hypothetical protein